MNHIKQIKKLKKQLWAVIREYVIKRDKKCVTCGATGRLQVGHFCHKSEASAVYYDIENLNAQCLKCNLWLRGNSAAYSGYILNRYGLKTLKRLQEAALSKKTYQHTASELEALIKSFKKRLAALG